jgi:hypothetical protein
MNRLFFFIFCFLAVSIGNAYADAYGQYRAEWKSVLSGQVSAFLNFYRTLQLSNYSVKAVKQMVVSGDVEQKKPKVVKKEDYFDKLVEKLLKQNGSEK